MYRFNFFLIFFLLVGLTANEKSSESKLEDGNADDSQERVKRQLPCGRSQYRTIDGSCNNLNNINWGKNGIPYIRFLSPDYADGRDQMRRSRTQNELPSARLVSLNMVRDVNNEHPVGSHMVMQWGQLINHDITKKRSKELSCCDDGQTTSSGDPNCQPILLPSDDPAFQKRCLRFSRSDFVTINGRREQINDVTAFVDASPVYGSTDSTARSLRSLNGGTLKSLNRPFGKHLLPTMASDPNSFSSGDSRANMIPSLVIIHVLLLREHNRLADNLRRINPQWSDETLYQEARKILSALVQQITYREFLPVVLGFGNMRPLNLQNEGYFNGYDPTLNPTISNGFAVAAYRFGHSLVQSHLKRFTPDLREIPAPPLAMEFFNVSSILQRDGEVDRITLGLLNQKTQQADSSFSGQIQHNLFGTDGTGSDLYALNIQRGRDHGIPGYNAWREFCGFPSFRDFSEMSRIMRPDTVSILQRLYNNVDDIDLYAAGMAEFPIQGGLVGPTFACIITRQFQNLRHGDRFWYENGGQAGSFSPGQLREIRKISLARIICDNTDNIERMQPEVMNVPSQSNRLVSCQDLPGLDLSFWRDGPDAANQVVDSNGPFGQDNRGQFNQQNRPFQRQPSTPRPVQPFRPVQSTARPLQSFRPQLSTQRPIQQFRPFQSTSRPFRPSTLRPAIGNSIQFSTPRPRQPDRVFQQNQAFDQLNNPNDNRVALFNQNLQSPNFPQSRPFVPSPRITSEFSTPSLQRLLQQQLAQANNFAEQSRFSGLSNQNAFGNRQLSTNSPLSNNRPNFNNFQQRQFPQNLFRNNQPQITLHPPPRTFNRFQNNANFVSRTARPFQTNRFEQNESPSVSEQLRNNFQNQFSSNGFSQNREPVHIFFTQGGQRRRHFSRLNTLRPQPGVILRVPGLNNNENDEDEPFGFMATF